MSREFGYCRISTGRQNIERQERNIRTAYPNAVIVKEVKGSLHRNQISEKERAGKDSG